LSNKKKLNKKHKVKLIYQKNLLGEIMIGILTKNLF
jgi:hypothetical protein